MAIPLRVLILEDEPADAELMVYALRQAGFDPNATRVDSEEDYIRGLEARPDVILADHRLPQYDSVRALTRLRERGLEAPFVVVSGTIGEDLAVELLKQGAADFVLNDRLARLGPAVGQALEHQRLRAQKLLAEQKLLASERRFRALIEWSSDGIALLDSDAKIRYTSTATVRILGYLLEEVLGRDAFDFVHPEDCPFVRAHFDGIRQSPGRVGSATFRALHNDGTWRWIEAVGTNLLAEPDMNSVVINYRDVTDREQGRQELQRQTRLLQSILQSMSEGVIVADTGERFLIFNPAAERMLGLGATDAPSSEWPGRYHLFLPDGATPHPVDQFPLLRAIRGETTTEMEVLVRPPHAPDGLLMLVSGRPVPDEAGDVIGGVIVCHDVTARRKAQETLAQCAEELARSNQELEQFAYVASHDLQEPLRMVSTFTQRLAQRYRGQLDPKADQYIAFAVEGCQRMQRLIEDLLTYSRVRTRGRTPEPVDSGAVLDRTLADLRPAIAEAGAEVTHDPMPTVAADPVQLGQVFQNLIGNALKFHSDQPPRIHVTARRDGGRWVLGVTDNGIGIDPQYFERIFVMFQRLHTREEYPGTGIGLAVCKKVVERHGGRIWVESQLGRGSTFYVSLPAVSEGTRP
jgi:PAS domain S-box-containing protein